MDKPNFLIIGAAKCGTTALFDQLGQHPEVFSPSIKEPGFLVEKNHLSSIKTENEYKDLFIGSEKYKAAGEATVNYMADPKTPELIRKNLGNDVKIIAILRNPIDMAYSLWKHRKREVKEELSFMKAIEAWPIRKRDPGFVENRIEFDWDYVGRAKFYSQLRAFQEFQNLKVLIFEEYIQDVSNNFKDLCRFLEISDNFDIPLDRSNVSFSPKSKNLQKVLMHQSPIKDLVKKIIPVKLLVPFKNYIERFNKGKDEIQPLSKSERVKLKSLLEEDVQSLQKFLKKDLSEYWSDFN